MIKTTVQVEGMMCNNCEAHVNEAVQSHFKVEKVTSDHTKGETVILSEDSLDKKELSGAIENAGYRMIESKEEPYVKTKKFSFGKTAD